MNEDEIISCSILENNQKEKLSESQLEEKKQRIKKQNMIGELAFMSVTLEDNREHIEKYGVKELYMNGKGQFGYKESVESKNYNVMIKNYTNIVKQLVDFLPKEEKKGAGEDLLKFIASGRK